MRYSVGDTVFSNAIECMKNDAKVDVRKNNAESETVPEVR
jgi:hypothetical protein